MPAVLHGSAGWLVLRAGWSRRAPLVAPRLTLDVRLAFQAEPVRPPPYSAAETQTGCARTRRSVGRPRWTSPSMCSIACWSWDARATSASPDPDGVGVSAAAPLIRAPRCRPPHENAQAARLLRRPHANEPHRLP